MPDPTPGLRVRVDHAENPRNPRAGQVGVVTRVHRSWPEGRPGRPRPAPRWLVWLRFPPDGSRRDGVEHPMMWEEVEPVG